MTNKAILKVSLYLIIITIAIFIFYLIFIRPHIIGTYTPTTKDCQKSYDCNCVGNSCLCTYSKWLIENKVVCSKELINEEQY